MRNPLSAALFIGCICFVLGCASEQEDSVSSNTNTIPKQSELAALMRVMESHGDAVRKALKEGQSLPDRPKGIEKLLTARPTPNMSIHSGSFAAFVEQYQNSISELYAVEASDRSEAYNAVIKSCDNCHRVNCPGPLMKIEKMFYKQ